MGISRIYRRKAQWIGPLLIALLVTGCAGIKPYKARDNREEGMKKGLFTGSEGEFVIFQKTDEPKTGGEANKRTNKTAGDENRKMDSEEKKKEFKSGEQQP
jgi:hypothetical protein